ARDLLSRLLRTDSANAEYWVWMSAVVDTDRERVYCLESALKLDPTNRSALRGLVILGARKPADAELTAALRIPRRQVAAVSASTAIRRAPRINWGMVALSALAIFAVAILFSYGGPVISALGILGRRALSPPPQLATLSPTPSATPVLQTPTATPLPAATRVLRTPVPTEFGGTPLALLVPFTMTPTPIVGATPHNEYEAYQSGLEALAAGRYEEALGYFDQVAKLAPRLEDVQYLRGEALRLAGTPRQSFEAYDAAILLNRDFAPAYLGRGRAFMAIDDPTRGIADFEKAYKLDPQLEQAYLDLAQYHAGRRQYDKAEELLQRAIDRGVGTPLVLIRISRAQYGRTNYQDAVKNAIEGSAADPTIVEGYLAIGSGYYELGLYNDAVWPLKTYTLYAADDALGWSYLGRALVQTGDADGAREALDRSLGINERHGPAHQGKGFLALLLGDGQAALDAFKQARRFAPDNYELMLGVGRAYYLVGNYREAIRELNQAINLAGEEKLLANRERRRADGYVLLGLVYEATNPPLINDAIVQWRYILSMGGSSPEAVALAEQHLQALTGRVPTRQATWTASATIYGTTPTRTPTLTPTPGPSPTAGPSPTRTPTEEWSPP
ncbi:MAG: tetratricopeptide repeat protein, partial [Chloroflexi bacterium]|nr:tetratricopeptide repeat protein [Chloroflexota bacterium]